GLMRGTKWVKNAEKVYDGTAPTLMNDEHIKWSVGKDVGTYHAYSDAFGYDIVGGAYTITPKALTLSGVAAQTKTYDGNTAGDKSKFHATLVGVVQGEESKVSVTAESATYNSKDVATANKITYTGIALTGAGAGNYTIAATAQGTGKITPKELTLTLKSGTRFDKIYDGNAHVTKTLALGADYTLGGFVTGEGSGIALASVTGTYTAGKDAGMDKTVVLNAALQGAGAENYTVANTAQGVGTITPKALTLGAVTAQTKTYDGNTAGDASKFHATLVHAVGGDSVSATATGATYNDKNVASATTVTYKGIKLAGRDAKNYTLAATEAQGAGTITRRTLTFAGVAAQTKTYDGNTAAEASKFRATLGNVVRGEENSVSATATGATYNDKNVVGANTVHYTGVALQGTGAANYSLANSAQGAGTITKRPLTLGEVAAQTKIYDGNTAADASQFHATLGNVVAGEENSVSATAAGAAYNDKNVARANTVHYTGVALTGAGAGNYIVANRAQGVGTITRRELTHSAIAGRTFDKIYDGTTNAAGALQKNWNYTLSNFAHGEGEGIRLTGTGSYSDKDVGTGKTVHFSSLALQGNGADNYKLPAGATLSGTGVIMHRTLTLVADVKHAVEGRRMPDFTGRADGFADGEDLGVFAPGALTFTSAVANTEKPGRYAVTGSIGGVSSGYLGNYHITQAAGNARAFTIHVAPGVSGLFTALVQDAKPVFYDGYSPIVYGFGNPRPVRAATLGLYRFDAETDLEIQGLHL
ncbi:MAG: YDG domain-containing protein, partial [Schwartzia sp. (in: firmicutes)]